MVHTCANVACMNSIIICCYYLGLLVFGVVLACYILEVFCIIGKVVYHFRLSFFIYQH